MMVCKKCGIEFPDGLFCPECGAMVEVGYDKERYGPQGKLEEQKISKEMKLAGIKMVFENKILIFEHNITIEENTELEFLNCSFVVSKCEAILIRGKNIRIDFRNCCFEGEKSIVVGSYDNSNHINLEFRNSAFISDGTGKAVNYLLRICGNIYFDNCFINHQKICRLAGVKWKSELEFRECVIAADDASGQQEYGDSLIYVKNAEVKFINCFIRSFSKLVNDAGTGSETNSGVGLFGLLGAVAEPNVSSPFTKLLIENTYLGTYLYSNEKKG